MIDFNSLRDKGISQEYGAGIRGFMPYSEDEKGSITVDYAKASQTLANDSAMTTAPNIGAPAPSYTYVSPKIIPILFAVRNATKIFGETRMGSWTDDFAQFPVEEGVGSVAPYSDYAEGASSDVNYEYPTRQAFRFQTTINYGDLEVARAGQANIQLVARKQEQSAESIAFASNKFYLYGVAGMKIYGFLNDPNLPASISPISVNSKSTWADKKADKPAEYPNAVFNDVNKLFIELSKNNGGLVDQNSPLVLCISNTRAPELFAPNTHGLTANELLKRTFPNLQIVTLPELSTNAGEMLYMTVPTLNGQETGAMAFAEKMRLSRVVQDLTSAKQKAMASTWGCVIFRPTLVVSMLGV